jgi:ribosomal protein S27AE
MERILFSGFGIDIIERGMDLYIRYDDGSIVTQSREDPITRVEAARAQRSEKDAYEVILSCQYRSDNGSEQAVDGVETMTGIIQISAREAGVEPALISDCETHGLVFFTWAEAPVIGAQCGHCHTILWIDPRADRILDEAKPDTVPDHGTGYRLYYEDNLKRFLGSLPPCPNCGKHAFNRFINNVQWCRFSDGTEIPEDIAPERIILQPADSCLVWMHRQ